MALGKNIKIDKLIPSKKEEKEKVVKEDSSTSKNEETVSQKEEVVQATESKNAQESPKEQPISESSDEKPTPNDINEEDIKVEFKPSKRKTQKRIIITIKGDLSVKNVHLLKNQIPFIFDHYNFVEIKLQEITAIDITALQLFHLMRVMYGPEKKFVAIHAEFTDEQQQLLTACGFTEFHTQIKARA